MYRVSIVFENSTPFTFDVDDFAFFDSGNRVEFYNGKEITVVPMYNVRYFSIKEKE